MKVQRDIHILCAPRSASTVIGVALAQHRSLLFCPEVNLWGYETLADMFEHDAAEHKRIGARNTIVAGLGRTLIEASDMFTTEEEAFSWLYDRRAWSTLQIQSYLSHLMKPRHAVYKSTRLSVSPSGLERLAATLGTGLIVQLIRNPLAVIRSLAETAPCAGDLDIHASTWLYANQNINKLIERIGAENCVVLRVEKLLDNPLKYLTLLCHHSGSSVQPEDEIAMLRPEASPYAGCSHPMTEYYMDEKFLNNAAFGVQPSAKLNPSDVLNKLSPKYRQDIQVALTHYGYE